MKGHWSNKEVLWFKGIIFSTTPSSDVLGFIVVSSPEVWSVRKWKELWEREASRNQTQNQTRDLRRCGDGPLSSFSMGRSVSAQVTHIPPPFTKPALSQANREKISPTQVVPPATCSHEAFTTHECQQERWKCLYLLLFYNYQWQRQIYIPLQNVLFCGQSRDR